MVNEYTRCALYLMKKLSEQVFVVKHFVNALVLGKRFYALNGLVVLAITHAINGPTALCLLT